MIIGINGCQGSGKTTLADALVALLTHDHQLKCVAISIDDFYLTKAERTQLAEQVHPLLQTRGVPGTHDVALAVRTLKALTDGDSTVAIARFNKAQDDRAPESQWDTHQGPMDIVILEGWCVGAQAQPFAELIEPINTLEAEEDHEGSWRHFVNAQLQLDYPPLFDLLDVRIMLKAPSFDCVLRWRLEQEEKLKQHQQGAGIMSPAQIERFIAHYQRVTESTLQHQPAQVHFLLTLDCDRHITHSSCPVALP